MAKKPANEGWLSAAVVVGAVMLFPLVLTLCLIAFLAWTLCVAPSWIAYWIRLSRARVADMVRALDEEIEERNNPEKAPTVVMEETTVRLFVIDENAFTEVPDRAHAYRRKFDPDASLHYLHGVAQKRGWKKIVLTMSAKEVSDVEAD